MKPCLDLFSRYMQRQEYLSPHIDSNTHPRSLGDSEIYDLFCCFSMLFKDLCCPHRQKRQYIVFLGANLLQYTKQINSNHTSNLSQTPQTMSV